MNGLLNPSLIKCRDEGHSGAFETVLAFTPILLFTPTVYSSPGPFTKILASDLFVPEFFI